MVRKLVLTSILVICLASLILLPIFGTGEVMPPTLFRASSVHAQAAHITIDGADAVWEAATQNSDGLVNAANEIPARILIEYADSILSKDLQKPEQLNQQASSVSPRILVEYADSILSIDLERPLAIVPAPAVPPSPTPTPAPTPTPQPVPVSPAPSPQPQPPALEPGQPYVDLYGHMTDVTVGDEIIMYLSVVNPITSPGTLVVQLTLRIPSGWSITSSGFGHGAGGLRTNTYEIGQVPNPQEIDVHILANEAFEGNVIGYMDYYFRGEEETKYRHEASLPVKARPFQPEPATPAPVLPTPTPWWHEPQWLIPVIIAVIACIAGIIRLLVMLGRRRY